MRLRLLAATGVIAALIGACQREPLAPGRIGTGVVGGTGIGGRAQDATTGLGGDGAGTGGAGSGGTGIGSPGLGGAAGSGGTDSGGGTGGAAGGGGTAGGGGVADCPGFLQNDRPCSSVGTSCFTIWCVQCSDKYWRFDRAGLCMCRSTGSSTSTGAPPSVWSCPFSNPMNTGVDCFFDPPLSCATAQALYEDPTCETHPTCEPAN